MEKKNTQSLIIEAQGADGSQNASIKLPLSLLHFGVKIVNLLPASVKERIDKELAAKGVNITFDSLFAEGQDALVDTLKNIQIDVQDPKQRVKVFVA